MKMSEPISMRKPSEDIDVLLHDFFQHEAPKPWPGARTPMSSPTTSRWSIGRSRLALAASVAFLIGGWLFLSGKFTDQPNISSGDLEATRHPIGSKPIDDQGTTKKPSSSDDKVK